MTRKEYDERLSEILTPFFIALGNSVGKPRYWGILEAIHALNSEAIGEDRKLLPSYDPAFDWIIDDIDGSHNQAKQELREVIG